LAQNEVRADIFSGSLAVFQSERVASPPEADRCGGRKGGLGGIPPALQILGEISSNFFESTPPVFVLSFVEMNLTLYGCFVTTLYRAYQTESL